MSQLKQPNEIKKMAASGRQLAEILDEVKKHVRVGISTGELDRIAAKLMQDAGVKPAFLGYRGYPGVLCTSRNEQVVHGIPSNDEILQNGDLLSIDIGIVKEGWYADMAETVAVGNISYAAERLMSTTREALQRGIAALKIGEPLGRVGAAVQSFSESRGYGVVRDLCGHGIGRAMHEDPMVPNYGSAESGPIVQPGLVIAIEPMITAGKWQVKTLADGWTVVTADGGLSAHFEKTVAVTEHGVEILTGLSHGKNSRA
ncbi:MAG: type I methionyl aminopeptidase [Candidatus Nomurabacteria bacterium]|nr:MAG: type I methionyl aminopeptidase [Candidatus Nomurabacteria bacterium]